jgi:hypothetical protein
VSNFSSLKKTRFLLGVQKTTSKDIKIASQPSKLSKIFLRNQNENTSSSFSIFIEYETWEHILSWMFQSRWKTVTIILLLQLDLIEFPFLCFLKFQKYQTIFATYKSHRTSLNLPLSQKLINKFLIVSKPTRNRLQRNLLFIHSVISNH